MGYCVDDNALLEGLRLIGNAVNSQNIREKDLFNPRLIHVFFAIGPKIIPHRFSCIIKLGRDIS